MVEIELDKKKSKYVYVLRNLDMNHLNEICSVFYVFSHCMAWQIDRALLCLRWDYTPTGYLVIAIGMPLTTVVQWAKAWLVFISRWISFLDKCYWMLVDFLSVCHLKTDQMSYIWFEIYLFYMKISSFYVCR